MSGVSTHEVANGDAGVRLDRWFRRHFPNLSHGRLEKLLRTGQVRVDGKRARAGLRLVPGQVIRVPPLAQAEAPARARTAPTVRTSRAEAAGLRAAVLHIDDDVIALNKPPGLAVQGGTKTLRHLDAMLGALRFGANRPRLVHRLDKDTSGVLLLARDASAARALTAAFRERSARKIYWALVVGVPRPRRGRIELALAKLPGRAGERMVAGTESGKRAVSFYCLVEAAAKEAAWLALMPLTGRTHQLRAHCAALGTPILGDGKYGAKRAYLKGLSRKVHLHARSIVMPRPAGGELRVTAPLPEHMIETWRFFGFDPEDARDPFAGYGT